MIISSKLKLFLTALVFLLCSYFMQTLQSMLVPEHHCESLIIESSADTSAEDLLDTHFHSVHKVAAKTFTKPRLTSVSLLLFVCWFS